MSAGQGGPWAAAEPTGCAAVPQEQASWVCRCEDRVVQRLEQDFKVTLQQQNSLEQWAAWLDGVVSQVLKPYQGSAGFPKAAKLFLLKWSFYRCATPGLYPTRKGQRPLLKGRDPEKAPLPQRGWDGRGPRLLGEAGPRGGPASGGGLRCPFVKAEVMLALNGVRVLRSHWCTSQGSQSRVGPGFPELGGISVGSWGSTGRAGPKGLFSATVPSSMVIRDLTLRSAASFGSFHLIRLLYDEYMYYLIEHRVAQAKGETPIAVMGEVRAAGR